MSELPASNLPLSQLSFYLTEGCNLACRVCRQPASGDPSQPGTCAPPTSTPERLAPELFEQALSEALPLGLQTVKLTGRDPLLHPRFDAFLERLSSTPVDIIIETSGAGLTRARAKRLAQLQAERQPARQNGTPERGCVVVVGLEGADAQTHDTLSGQPGSFAQAMRALEELARAGLAPQMAFSILRQNAEQVAEMVRLGEACGANPVRFHLPSLQPSDGALPDGSPAADLQVEELIALGRRVERELARVAHVPLHFDQPPAFRGLNPKFRVDPVERCAVRNALSVLVSGEYALCGVSQMAPELVLGRVGLEPLAALWREHPLLGFLRAGLPAQLTGVCARCMLKDSCLGRCVVMNYYQSGSFWGPFWFCQAAEQAGLFPASRLMESCVR